VLSYFCCACVAQPRSFSYQDTMASAATGCMSPRRKHPFKGRTVATINDLSRDEQWYLYQKTKRLKEAVKNGEDLTPFRLKNTEAAVYTIFMEDSTRTKESFRNAAEFHGTKVNMFDTKSSSFQKNETITDTIKMLAGYSIGQSIFVIRSKIEGVCRWLEEAIADYCKLRGYPQASFINGGDGRHEHPTQELLDEFSFLECNNWETSSIHLALIGDLFHGRTVHSKADGLRLYNDVHVDLIAPPDLAMPKLYDDRMVGAGFKVRRFASIEEYLSQPNVAKIWYFTRLQLERMGDKVLSRSAELRQAVSMRHEFVEKLPANTRFFHPLPRDARFPTLPFWLDNTEHNAWDQQSQNGYFTRIILLGMLGGLFGEDFEARIENSPASPSLQCRKDFTTPPLQESNLQQAADFIKKIQIPDEQKKEAGSVDAGLVPITNGAVIDHIAEGQAPDAIWRLVYKVRTILQLNGVGGQGVFRTPVTDKMRGLISVPDVDIQTWDRSMLKKLAAVAPGSTLNLVRDGIVYEKYCLQVPPRIYGFSDISCKNTACVCYPSNGQHEVKPYFQRSEERDQILDSSNDGSGNRWAFTCRYCEQLHSFADIWDSNLHVFADA